MGAQAAATLGSGRTARGGGRQTLCWALWGALGGGALGRRLALLLVLLAGHLGGSSVSLDTFKEKVRAKLKASSSPVSSLTRAYVPNPSCLLSCDV